MEAVSKHDFQATADDELSFSKGAKLKVRICMNFWPVGFFYLASLVILLCEARTWIIYLEYFINTF